MKKRILLVAIALALLLVVLASCANYGDTLNNITELLQNDYSKVVIKVTTDYKGATLNGEYTLTFNGDVTSITYWYEELNEISMNGSNSFKTTVGPYTATVQNGKVIDDNGNEVNLNTQSLDFTGFSFKQKLFKNATATGNKFDADVRNPKAFLGNSSFKCSNMHVKVIFVPKAITEMTLTYTSANSAKVNVVYKFTV